MSPTPLSYVSGLYTCAGHPRPFFAMPVNTAEESTDWPIVLHPPPDPVQSHTERPVVVQIRRQLLRRLRRAGRKQQRVRLVSAPSAVSLCAGNVHASHAPIGLFRKFLDY
jgi:hypothetical protein